ncbi:hypothetical protein [Bordetella sp. 2513F-2]
MSLWLRAIKEGVITGTCASLASTAILAAAGRRETGSMAAPTNATSQWVWGRPALHADAPSTRHTVPGYLIHHAASVLWATLYARATCHRPHARQALPAVAGGLATAAVACWADFRLTPQRFTPGFEHRLSRPALATVYAGFGLAIALATLAVRRRS